MKKSRRAVSIKIFPLVVRLLNTLFFGPQYKETPKLSIAECPDMGS